MWSFHERFSSNNTHGNLIDGIFSILQLFFWSLGNVSCMSSFLTSFIEKWILRFSDTKRDFIIRSHWLISLNLIFTVANIITRMSQFEKNRLLSSANIIGSRIFEAFGKSLTESTNRSGPNIEPCGTPHVNDKKSGFFLSLIWINCFLFLK